MRLPRLTTNTKKYRSYLIVNLRLENIFLRLLLSHVKHICIIHRLLSLYNNTLNPHNRRCIVEKWAHTKKDIPMVLLRDGLRLDVLKTPSRLSNGFGEPPSLSSRITADPLKSLTRADRDSDCRGLWISDIGFSICSRWKALIGPMDIGLR